MKLPSGSENLAPNLVLPVCLSFLQSSNLPTNLRRGQACPLQLCGSAAPSFIRTFLLAAFPSHPDVTGKDQVFGEDTQAQCQAREGVGPILPRPHLAGNDSAEVPLALPCTQMLFSSSWVSSPVGGPGWEVAGSAAQ